MVESPNKSRALRRSTLLCLLIFAVFGLLLLRILLIQTVDFDKYQSKVINQMTTESPVIADRGKIYDRNGNVLATNVTTYRVFVSPSAIKAAQKEDGREYADAISKGLSVLIDGVTYDSVYSQIEDYSNKLDRTIARKVSEDKADEIRGFIAENRLENMIFLEAQSTRYYPGGTLAAHVLGFSGSDGTGLYGLELQYDKYLKGVNGYYILARDSYGNEIPFKYSSYIEAIPGYDVNTTLDSTVQGFLEEQLAALVEEYNVENRACGIVMDVNSGAILAMATSSPFDLNEPWTLDRLSQATKDRLLAGGYPSSGEEYDRLSRELLGTMWSNKAVSESYIPGSTFKIITASMALEEKLVSLGESVNCPGHKTIFGQTIHCHQTKGHGDLTFAQGLQQSCNVWFMTLGERLGIEDFKKYTETFGYNAKTGIDLPGEGNSIFASEMTGLDLAIYAFGQNFNVTPIQQITAIASVAGGGELLTPYLVQSITDTAGNTVYRHNAQPKRATISEETCKIISQILEDGVSGDGGAKNAYVAGYRVAAKTGTSEKKERECHRCGGTGVLKNVEGKNMFVCNLCGLAGTAEDFPASDEYICSTVAYAPADDPQIAVIIIVDEPHGSSLYGSTVAAPYVAGVLKNTMPYLGIEARYSEAELKRLAVKVGGYRGWGVDEAKQAIEESGLRCRIVGDGEVVTSQMPAAGTVIERVSGTIVLYADAKVEQDVVVPDLSAMVASTANQTLVNLGLNIKIEGSASYLSGTGYRVVSQSIAPGTRVAKGTVITVTFAKVKQEQ